MLKFTNSTSLIGSLYYSKLISPMDFCLSQNNCCIEMWSTLLISDNIPPFPFRKSWSDTEFMPKRTSLTLYFHHCFPYKYHQYISYIIQVLRWGNLIGFCLTLFNSLSWRTRESECSQGWFVAVSQRRF